LEEKSGTTTPMYSFEYPHILIGNVVSCFVYEKKPECPVLCTGMNGQHWFGGVSPQAFKAFSLEEPRPLVGVLHY
jgi:hypothetical protein